MYFANGFHDLVGNVKDGVLPITPKTIRLGLKTGDYSIQGFESQIVVERKSLSDLYGSVGGERERFHAEHERMAEIVAAGGFACVVIEAGWSEILTRPPDGRKLVPKTIIRTATSWAMRYGVHWMALENRRLAEVTTFRILDTWYRHHMEEQKKKQKEQERNLLANVTQEIAINGHTHAT